MSAVEEESAVKVCVRVRPLIQREEAAATESAEPVRLYWKADRKSIHQIDDCNPGKSFSFDRVFSADETTIQLYQDIAKPLVVSAVEGYNGTIFAYGQTSSGKTFTMMGSDLAPGVLPMAMEEVFLTIKKFPKKEFLLRVSYMEIYNETVTDLLVDSWKRKPLEVREGINKNIYVADLTEELVTSPTQALVWIRKGEKNRRYGKTKMNQRSSRSHTIFRMILESRELSDPVTGESPDGAIIVSHLNLVDLAGSERASQTGAEGARFKEGCNINRSLFTLGQVIKKLSDEGHGGFTNYRDSKLTRILQNSLGGNAKTVIICTVTPVTVEETLSTLQFASTAKKMKNDPHVTEVSDDGALLKRYRNEIVDLKRRLQEVSSVTQTTATEKETLSQLLQEKDQLQKEQQDRIKNLTKLLVTGANLVPIKKVPKRRVTWGGKLLPLAVTTECDNGQSDLSFAEPLSRKRKGETTSLELVEEDEEFDSRWEIPEDYDYVNQTNIVDTHSFGESPQFVSPSRRTELSENVSSLEVRLEEENRLKEEAQTKATSLEVRLEEENRLKEEAQTKATSLEVRLEEENRLKEEAQTKATSLEVRLEEENRLKEEAQTKATSLEVRLEEENRLKEEAQTKATSLEVRLEEENRLKEEAQTKATSLEVWLEEENRLKEEAQTKAISLEVQLEEENRLKEEAQTKATSLEVRLEEENRLKEEAQTKATSLEVQLEEENRLKEEAQTKATSLEVRLEEENRVKEEAQTKATSLEVQLEEENRLKEEAQTKATSLEVQLEEENRLKEEAQTKAISLEVQLEEENRLKEQVERTGRRVEELEVQLAAQVLEKQQAVEKAEMLELRLVDLETELDQASTGADEQMKREFAETIQLCETLVSEKESASVEGTYLKEELGLFMEQVATLEKEKAALVQEVKESRELEEFNSLEDDIRKEHEREIQSEISSLKTAVASWELKCQELESKLGSMSEQLTKKSAWIDQLESLKDKDLVQQVSQLRRSLDDAEGLSRDTRKEWAVLRSQNIALKERDVELTTSHDKMTAEAGSLRSQLEAEKSRNRKMQSDLQKELNVAFEENTKLTALLDGKVPKNLVEAVALERTVAALTKELAACRETESALKREVSSLQKLPERVSELTKQSCELQTELCTVQTQRDGLLSEGTQELEAAQERLLQVHQELRAKETELARGSCDAAELAATLRSQLERCHLEESQLRTAAEEADSRLDSSEQQRTSLEEQLSDLQRKVTTLTEKMADGELSRSMEEEISRELQEQVKALGEELEVMTSERDGLLREKTPRPDPEEMDRLRSEVSSLTQERDQLQQHMNTLNLLSDELDGVRAERDGLLSEKTSSSDPEEMDRLRSEVSSLTQERDQLQEILEGLREEKNQLKMDLQENVDMMIENQEELRNALEKTREQKQQIKQLESLQTANQNAPVLDSYSSQMEDLQNHVKALSEELDGVRSERDGLLREKTSSSDPEEMDRLRSEVSSFTQERDQLTTKLQQHMNTVNLLSEELDGVRSERDGLLREKTSSSDPEEMDRLRSEVSSFTQERDQLTTKLQQHMNTLNLLSEELDGVRSERDGLLREKTSSSDPEEMDRLRSEVSSLTQERDQLQEILEGLREEKNQLREELEDKMEMIQSGVHQHPSLEHQSLKEEQDTHRLQQIQLLEEELESVKAESNQLKTDLQENVEMTIDNQEELREAQEKIRTLTEELVDLRTQKTELNTPSQTGPGEDNSTQLEELQTQIQKLSAELDGVRSERDGLLREKTTRPDPEEMDRLRSEVSSLTQERDQLTTKLQQHVDTLNLLSEELDGVRSERDGLLSEKTTHPDPEEMDRLRSEVSSFTQERDQLTTKLQQHVDTLNLLSEELDGVRSERDGLLREKTTSPDPEEMDRLRSEVSSLTQERDQLTTKLQQHVNTLNLLSEELDGVRTERDGLLSEKTTCPDPEEMDRLRSEVSSFTQERDQLTTKLQQHVNTLNLLSEELDGVRSERDGLLSEKTTHPDPEEMDRLQSEVSSLTQERDQLTTKLQQHVNTLNLLSDELDGVRSERDGLLREKTSSSDPEEMDRLRSEVSSLTQERDQLQDILEGLREEKNQLREELKDKMEMMQKLSAELEVMRSERDGLLSEMSSPDTEEMDRLRSEVSSLTQERDQLQEILEGLREEKNQLREELEDKMIQQLETDHGVINEERGRLQKEVATVREEKRDLQKEVATVREEKRDLQKEVATVREEKRDLQKEVQQLEEEVSRLQERLGGAEAQIQASQQALSEANNTISSLQNEVSNLDKSITTTSSGALSSRFQDTTCRLKETFGGFQRFMASCSLHSAAPLERALLRLNSLMLQHRSSLPKASVQLHNQVNEHCTRAVQSFRDTTRLLKGYAAESEQRMVELVQSDLAVFEQRRLQDALLNWQQAPGYAVPKDDPRVLWEHRVAELLENRERHLQKTTSLLEALEDKMASYPSRLSGHLGETQAFLEQLEAVYLQRPLGLSRLETLLTSERERCSAATQHNRGNLQAIREAQTAIVDELQALCEEAAADLGQEKSKTLTLLQALEDPDPLKNEVQLLKDNQQLHLQLLQTRAELKALQGDLEQLEEAQVRTSDRLSNHKQATQLLQTELQDTCAQVQEKEKTIQTLKSKLRLSEEANARKEETPSGVELEALRNKVAKLEDEVASASAKYQEETQRLNTLLQIKEESLRKLREVLRKSQREEPGSFLQGEDLYARMTNPRACTVQSSVQLEKVKLEGEVNQLQMKIQESESLISNQQTEISKWKRRAIKLKEKNVGGVADKPPSSAATTPSKRHLPTNFDSPVLNSPKRFHGTPRKVLDSPGKTLDSPRRVLESPSKAASLNSPKSAFFDGDAGLGRLLKRRPKPFFDEPNLGVDPEMSCVPTITDDDYSIKEGASASAEEKEDWWPLSPSKDGQEMCKTQ